MHEDTVEKLSEIRDGMERLNNSIEALEDILNQLESRLKYVMEPGERKIEPIPPSHQIEKAERVLSPLADHISELETRVVRVNRKLGYILEALQI